MIMIKYNALLYIDLEYELLFIAFLCKQLFFFVQTLQMRYVILFSTYCY